MTAFADLLKENHLHNLSVRTAQRWLVKLGFEYCTRKKNYYNDKHESPANIAYRHQFIKRYFQYKLWAYRWVQFPVSEYNEMCNKGYVFSGKGYKYNNDKNEPYIEFHIDDNPTFPHREGLHPFGGNLSVRKPPNLKPLVIIRQDECIYKQFSFRSKCWVGPGGEVPLMTKSDGQGLMVSVFVCRELGFGLELSSQLEKVNNYRKYQKYCDEKAAIERKGKIEKDKLTTTPFKRFMQYGNMSDGYWLYEDMIIQVEDCVDCLKALYGNTYNYLFLFDHSNGHDCLSPDALSPTAIRKEFGGKQPYMKNSKILNDKFLGPHDHPHKLKVRDIQKMHFTEDDIGPFYLSEKERNERRADKIIGAIEIKMTKPEMVEALSTKGIKDPKGNRKNSANYTTRTTSV